MSEPPPSLSPQVRALLRSYRDAHAMPEDAKARVQSLLDTPTAAASAGRPSWMWGGVGALAAGLLLWGMLSISGAWQSSSDDAPPSQASMRSTDTDTDVANVATQPPATRHHEPRPAPPSDVRPDLAPPPLEPPTQPRPGAPSRKVEPKPAPKRSPSPPLEKPAPEPEPEPKPEPEAQTPASRLGAENRLIAQTWEHVRAEHYGEAKMALAEHAKSFPSGVLAPERRALEVIVDCLAHPEATAGKAEAYARTGRTTLLAKVRSACTEGKSRPR